MQRKIFIGVDLSLAVKRRLMQKTKDWQDLPIRWSREENLHLSIMGLGYVDDRMVLDVCSKVKKAVSELDIFDIDFDKIELGPSVRRAKMVWFSGEENKSLKELHKNIEQEMNLFKGDKKGFYPHIILGRIKQYGWKKLKKVPRIEGQLHIAIPVESIKIFESTIVDGKRTFTAIETCSLIH